MFGVCWLRCRSVQLFENKPTTQKTAVRSQVVMKLWPVEVCFLCTSVTLTLHTSTLCCDHLRLKSRLSNTGVHPLNKSLFWIALPEQSVNAPVHLAITGRYFQTQDLAVANQARDRD